MSGKADKDGVIYLPGEQSAAQPEPAPSFDELTPREIVVELDKYIVGQTAAKRAVAIAWRNRVRRQKLQPEMAEEVLPKNILMIGPTGVGKTEIARRLARLAGAPFVKVEASKFTEVGYVGRDVETMVRDLVDAAINLVRTEREDEVYDQAEQRADERLLDLLLPAPPPQPPPGGASGPGASGAPSPGVFVVSSGGAVSKEKVSPEEERRRRSREKLRQMLLEGKLDDREVEVEVSAQSYPPVEFMPPPPGMEGTDV